MSVVYYSNSQPICLESLAAFVQIWIVVGVNVTDISFLLLFQHFFLWVCHLKFGFCRELQLDAKSGSCKTKEKCDCLVITWYFPYAVLFFFSLYQYISKQNVAFYTSGATSQIRWAYGTELWKCYSPNTLVKMEPCQIMIMWYKIY